MPFFLYGSFPNSRNRPRNPTTVAQTVSSATVAGNDIVLGSADQNRTYLLLRNLDTLNNIYYGYLRASGTGDPTVIPTFGFIGDLVVDATIVNEEGAGVPGNLYVKLDNGITTNWGVTTLNTGVGFTLKPLDSVLLFSPQMIIMNGGGLIVPFTRDLGDG